MNVWRLTPLLLVGLATLNACAPGAITPFTPTPPASPTSTPLPSETPPPTQTSTPAPVGTNIHLELPVGDPVRGESLASQHFCVACHITFRVAPPFVSSDELPSISARATLRMADPSYSGQASTTDEYLIESILVPDIFVVAWKSAHPMDDYYDERLSAQELADLLAWLRTFE